MSSVQGVEFYRYLFNSVELRNRTRDGGRRPGSNFACDSWERVGEGKVSEI